MPLRPLLAALLSSLLCMGGTSAALAHDGGGTRGGPGPGRGGPGGDEAYGVYGAAAPVPVGTAPVAPTPRTAPATASPVVPGAGSRPARPAVAPPRSAGAGSTSLLTVVTVAAAAGLCALLLVGVAARRRLLAGVQT